MPYSQSPVATGIPKGQRDSQPVPDSKKKEQFLVLPGISQTRLCGSHLPVSKLTKGGQAPDEPQFLSTHNLSIL